MTQPAKSQEPSMEEILASIRRIIADDDATKSVQRAADAAQVEAQPVAAPPTQQLSHPPPPTPSRPYSEPESQSGVMADAADADPSPDILELTESMAAPMPQSSAVNSPGAMPRSTPQFRTIDGSSDVDFADPAARSGGEERGQLISSETSAAVDSAFNVLAQTVLVKNARTLEDLVREMLRPMLKTWLDDNLPGLVERLVRAEIERVSRGRAD